MIGSFWRESIDDHQLCKKRLHFKWRHHGQFIYQLYQSLKQWQHYLEYNIICLGLDTSVKEAPGAMLWWHYVNIKWLPTHLASPVNSLRPGDAYVRR